MVDRNPCFITHLVGILYCYMMFGQEFFRSLFFLIPYGIYFPGKYRVVPVFLVVPVVVVSQLEGISWDSVDSADDVFGIWKS